MTGVSTPVVCLVTDRRRLAPLADGERAAEALVNFLAQAVDAGVDLIQIRERDLDAALLCDVARRAIQAARGTHVRILVNDRADVALAARADGVHLRADGMPTRRVRSLSPAWLIGRSVHSADLGAPDLDADYLLFGTVFSTASKPDLLPAGLQPLATLAATSSKPVLAIGGITPANARECRLAGAAGIAAIGAFLPEGTAPGALGVHEAARAFREALGEASQ